MSVTRVVRLGNALSVRFDDGTQVLTLPTGRGVWLAQAAPATDSGGGSTPPPSSGIPPASDDYPWPTAAINTMSPLRYDYRECVDFVAWRINRDAGCTSSPWTWDWSNLTAPSVGDGNAVNWKPNWQALGWPVDIAPVPGCIAWFSTEVGALGHVAYVQSVSGSNVVLEEYNWGGTHNYDTRTVPASTVDSFLKSPV